MSVVPPTIALFFGTRPQVIKASVLRRTLAQVGQVVAIDTGQHYDYALHQVHYDELEVPPPDVHLGVGSGSHAAQTAAILTAAEAWIEANHPRVAIVIGDTNSTLACALAAAKVRVPVAHVEAGLHAEDRLMPEEINRRTVDAIAELLFAPSARVASELGRRAPHAEIVNTGDVAYDVLRHALPRVPVPERVTGYDKQWGSHFVYATLHRAELVDSADRLASVMQAMQDLPLPCLFAAHPRTRAALERIGYSPAGAVRIIEPLGYLESLALTQCAAAVVTDSGGLQREAYWLGVPCLTLRNETEWGETIACGANRLIAPSRAAELPGAVASAIAQARAGASWPRDSYGEGHAAERVAEALGRWLQRESSSS
ncbi:MAG TPA: UDP-N-acetylglucosamine 2-epimerase (non-hydrolyzing) [Gemmatimonadales bacterium]|nr:UDP-N-acetylglucosamine 2-epimerase (non-hydrolyzing) [Gemmatimonadales bacterium]